MAYSFGDTQVAYLSSGKVHSISVVRNEADAQRFEATMSHQGFAVTHVARAERAKLPRRAVPAPVEEPAVASPAPVMSTPKPPTPDLPLHYAALVARAEADQLPHDTTFLASGLVTHLAEYVLAWAEVWPRDQAHVERRLDEALNYLSLLEKL